MKKSFFMLLVLACWAGKSWGQFVANLDDLNYWGSGNNTSAFVVYWNDSKSPDALAWGYKWDGTQTVYDMLVFLAHNDPRLFARIDSATSFGAAIFGIGYQTGSAPFGVTGAVDTAGNPVTPGFTAGINDLNTNPAVTEAPLSSTTAAPANAADRYVEGFNDNGYWELFHSGTDAFNLQPSYTLPTTWTSSWVGASITLVNNGWAAFSITQPDFTSNPPTAAVVAAIPEPSVGLLAFLGTSISWILLRKRQA